VKKVRRPVPYNVGIDPPPLEGTIGLHDTSGQTFDFTTVPLEPVNPMPTATEGKQNWAALRRMTINPYVDSVSEPGRGQGTFTVILEFVHTEPGAIGGGL
jgi:hypothetical protein